MRVRKPNTHAHLQPASGRFKVTLALCCALNHRSREAGGLCAVQAVAVAGDAAQKLVEERDLACGLVHHAVHVVEAHLRERDARAKERESESEREREREHRRERERERARELQTEISSLSD